MTPKKPTSTKAFLRKYIRSDLRNEQFIEAGEKDGHFPVKSYMPIPGMTILMAATPDGFLPVWEERLDNISSRYYLKNTLLVYRILKKHFGPPSPALIYIDEKSLKEQSGSTDLSSNQKKQSLSGPSPMHWHYFFQSDGNFIFEIRKEDHTLWLYIYVKENHTDEQVKNSARDMPTFLAMFKDFIENEKQHFENSTIKNFKACQTTGVINPYSNMLSAGDRAMTVADFPVDDVDDDTSKLVRNAENVFADHQYLYLSAALYYFMALEGFVNFLHTFLLREEYRNQRQSQDIRRLPLEQRLLMLPAYCNGFSSSGLAPDSDECRLLKRLSDWRNDILHNNITDDHRIYTIMEDGFMFQHDPATAEAKAYTNDHLPCRRELFNKDHAIYVRDGVRTIVNAVVERMKSPEKDWATKWLSRPIIMESSDFGPSLREVNLSLGSE